MLSRCWTTAYCVHTFLAASRHLEKHRRYAHSLQDPAALQMLYRPRPAPGDLWNTLDLLERTYFSFGNTLTCGVPVFWAQTANGIKGGISSPSFRVLQSFKVEQSHSCPARFCLANTCMQSGHSCWLWITRVPCCQFHLPFLRQNDYQISSLIVCVYSAVCLIVSWLFSKFSGGPLRFPTILYDIFWGKPWNLHD